MYKLEPIVDVRFRPEIPVPFCMYSLPPISQMLDPSVFNQRSKGDKESSAEPRKPDELDEILDRQELLLEKLTLLRNRLDDLRSPQPLQTTTQLGAVERGQHAICAKPPQTGAPGATIVLRCSPSRPPYAVLDILDILGEQYAVRLVAHAHSSVRVNTTLEALTKKLTEKPVVGGKPNLNVTLLWFDLAGDCDFLVKPLEQRRVRGEANVARHLYRLLPGNDYEKDSGMASSMDEKIDNLESHFLWKGKAGGEAVALAKKITADRSANRLVSLLAKSFLRNTKC